MAKRIPDILKKEAREEALCYCSFPSCYEVGKLDCHHINEDSNDNSIENLIYLCPTHHQIEFHRLKRPLSDKIKRLQRYKQLLFDFIPSNFFPGRNKTLEEIKQSLRSLYLVGDFNKLEDGCHVLNKAILRSSDLAKSVYPVLQGQISEYLGEIAIQRGKPYYALSNLHAARDIFKGKNDTSSRSHCLGLLAVGEGQRENYQEALNLLGESAKLLKRSGIHEEEIIRARLGWIYHMEASIYRHMKQFNQAEKHIELAQSEYQSIEQQLEVRDKFQLPLESVKLLLSSGQTRKIEQAYESIAKIEKTIKCCGWPSEKASLLLQKFYILRAMRENRGEADTLADAFMEAQKGDAGTRIHEVLEILINGIRKLPHERLYHALVIRHGECDECHNRSIIEIARCELNRLDFQAPLP